MNSADRQAVLHCLKAMIDEALCEECPLYGTTGTDHCEKDCVRLAIKALEQEPKTKTGHWIEHNKPYDIDGTYYCYCDNCGGDAHEKTDFCPNCGAKMEVEE